jgi:hypothetical protein
MLKIELYMFLMLGGMCTCVGMGKIINLQKKVHDHLCCMQK